MRVSASLRLVAVAVLGLAPALATSCVRVRPEVITAPVPVPADSAIVWSVLLAGDAGAPGPDDPALAALAREAARLPERTTVVFLGDNIYPTGLGSEDDPDRAEQEARLDRQVAVLRESGARGIFVPGNHDWAKGGPDGWAAIRRQGEWLRARGGGLVELAPAGGCPGPAVRDVGPVFRIVALDTQWWFHDHAKPASADGCDPGTGEASLAALARVVDAPDRQVIVAAHHPIRTGGVHGGYFTLRQHLFPLTELASWAWLPLPGLGSLYPLVRGGGLSPQDTPNDRNRALRVALEDAMAPARPLVYAAGHEHNLQVIEGGSARWLLVSGAGYADHTSPVRAFAATRWAEAATGFMRIDALQSGRVRLGVVILDADGRAHEAWSVWLH